MPKTSTQRPSVGLAEKLEAWRKRLHAEKMPPSLETEVERDNRLRREVRWWRDETGIKARFSRPAGAPVTKAFIKSNITIGKKGCWNWNLGVNDEGYGNVRHLGRECKTHRISWELWKGESPGKLKVCHDCDNPRCCNPKHLFLGTDLDNSHDAVRKDRFSRKITNAQARSIFYDKRQYKEIVKEYGISKGFVSGIKHKKSRKIAVENESHRGLYIPTDRRRHVP